MVTVKNALRGIVVRPANIYGAMMDKSIDRWSLVPNCFCKEGIEKGTITLLSTGKQSRNFLSLSDVCKLTIRISEKHKNTPYKAFNLGQKETFTILQIAKFTKEVFQDEFGISVELLIKGENPVQTNHFNIDTSEYDSFLQDIVVNEKNIKQEIKKIINLIK